MKTSVILSLAATALALPSRHERPSNASTCPANAAQPDGKLPAGSVSTSALVRISAKNPNKAYQNSEYAYITPNDLCTIFNLELDSDKVQGKVCNLVFDFPFNTPATPSTVTGPGHFTFTGYAINAGAIPGNTTYNNQPAPGPSPPNPPATLTPGNSYIINAAPCGIPPGIGKVTVSGSLCSTDSGLKYKQTTGGKAGCPLGFFVVLTDDTSSGNASVHP